MSRPDRRTILVSIALFFIFFILCFPYRNLRGYVFSEIYKKTQIRIEAEDISPAFLGWPGVHLYKAGLNIPVSHSWQMDLFAEQITARVGLGGLFPPVLSLSLNLHKFQKGGNVFVRGSDRGTTFRGTLAADRVNIGQFLTNVLPEPIDGTVNADGDFNYDTSELSRSTGVFNLSIDKLTIPSLNLSGIILPAVAWDEVRAKLVMKNGSLDITQCQFGTPKSDLRGTLTGSVRLGRDWNNSFLNLVLRIQMTEKYRNAPQSVTLVSFLKTFETKIPGEYAMKWAATLNDMSTNIMMALPQKAE